METVFLKIFGMSLEASVVVVAVLLLRLLFRNIPKWLHCLMWALVAVKLLCPIVPESPVSLMPAQNLVERGISESTITQSLDAPSESVPTVQADTTDMNRAEPLSPSHDIRQFGQTTESKPSLETIGSRVWLVGMGLLTLYAAAAYLAMKRKLAEAVPLEKGKPIYLCDRIDSAFVWGIVRPKIYLPFGMSEKNRRQVMAHEQAHLRRCDHLTKALAFGLAVVYWFNPAVWVAYFLYCRDIELACDESALRGKGTEERRVYSLALLECATQRNSFRLHNALSVNFGELAVKTRVANLFRRKTTKIWVIALDLLAVAVTGVALLTKSATYPVIPSENLDRAIAEQTFAYNRVSMSDLLGDRRYFYAAVSDFVGRSDVECYGEGHKIYGMKENKDGSLEVYAKCSAFGYGFRDGHLVSKTGYSQVPTLIRFEKDADGNYNFLSREEPKDGAEYVKSVRELFPRSIADRMLDTTRHNQEAAELSEQSKRYAEAYLKKIGREAEIGDYLDFDFKTLSDCGVSDEAANELLKLHAEYDFYVGNFERVESGTRYVYHLIWNDDGNNIGNGIVTFMKTRYDDGEEIEKISYQVKDNQIRFITIDTLASHIKR
ncbi:MAG: M56 family metallopeptidase [Clostridia bacterium]|nr:M56 family metallopeptidase [Clostridia bacterium]